MERCTSCQNILPRTVDRCPVCGEANAPLTAEDFDVPEVPKGKDFLAAVSAERVDAQVAPSGMRARHSLRKTGKDGGLGENRDRGRRRDNDFKLPNKAEQTRSVAAISSRLNSNIKLGTKASHSIIVVTSIVVAIASLGVGTALGFQRSDLPAAIAMSSQEIPTGAAASELVITGPVENFDPEMIATISEPTACGGPLTTIGLVVAGGTVVAPLTDTEAASTPTISSNGIQTVGQLLGMSNPNDIAVIRPADRLTNRIQLATNTTIRVGTRVAIISVDDELTLHPGVVTGFGTRDGAVHDFTVSTTFTDEGEVTPQEFSRGVFVLNGNGDLLGMSDNTGAFVTAARIAETVAQIQADPSFPQPVCG